MVSKYIPSDSDESFDMMNILEDRLQHTNSAVVLATIKVFLHLTISMADIHQQVFLYFLFFPSFRLNLGDFIIPKIYKNYSCIIRGKSEEDI